MAAETRSRGIDKRLVLALGLAALILAIFGSPEWPTLPRVEDGVRSFAQHSGFNPLSSYLQFAVRLLLCVVGMTLIWVSRPSPRILFAPVHALWRHPGAAAGILFLLGMAAFGLTNPAQPLWDLFHEGEWLEIIATIKAHPDDWHLRVFMIHGYGVDALPAWLSAHIWAEGHQVVGARLARLAIYALTVAGIWLSLREAVRHPLPRIGALLLFFAVSLIISSWELFWTWGGDTFVNLPLRRALLMSQLGLALLMLRAEPRRLMPLFLLSGLLLGLSPAWNIGDMPTGAVATLTALFIVLARDPFRAGSSVLALFAGTACGALLLHMMLPGIWGAIAEMIAYWSRYGRSIWTHAPIDYLLGGPSIWFNLIGHAGLTAWLALRLYRKGWRSVLQRDARTLLLLIVSLASVRAALDIGLTRGFAAINLLLFLAILSAIASYPGALSHRLATRSNSVYRTSYPRLAPLGAVSLVLGGIALHHAHPWTLPSALLEIATAVRQPSTDMALLSAPRQEMHRRLAALTTGERCTVFVATQSAWYHLLGVPSCSRWHTPLQASAPDAQREVLATILAERPRWIFTEVDDHMAGPADLSPRDRLPILFEGLRSHYQPRDVIGTVRPWERRAP